MRRGLVYFLCLISLASSLRLLTGTTPLAVILPIHSLSQAELTLIPSIGPVLANRLSEFNGSRFREIKGIGSKREAKLIQYLSLP